MSQAYQNRRPESSHKEFHDLTDILSSITSKGLHSHHEEAGLVAKIVAGHEKVLETNSGLRVPAFSNINETSVNTSIGSSHARHSTTRFTGVSIDKVPAHTDPLFPPLPVY